MNRKLLREKIMELLFVMILSKDIVDEVVEIFIENYESNISEIDLIYVK